MSSVSRSNRSRLASRSVRPLRVALLGRRLDQPRRQLGAAGADVRPTGRSPLRPAARRRRSPHPMRCARAALRRRSSPRAESALAVPPRRSPAGPPPRALDADPDGAREPTRRVARARRTGRGARSCGSSASFADEPESYHSRPRASSPRPDTRGESTILAATPGELRPRRHSSPSPRAASRSARTCPGSPAPSTASPFRADRFRAGPRLVASPSAGRGPRVRRAARRCGCGRCAGSTMVLSPSCSPASSSVTCVDTTTHMRHDERGPLGQRRRRHRALDHGRLGRDRARSPRSGSSDGTEKID